MKYTKERVMQHGAPIREVSRPARISPEGFAREVVKPGVPAVLRGIVADWPATEWDLDRIDAHLPKRTIRMSCASPTDPVASDAEGLSPEDVRRRFDETSTDGSSAGADWLVDVVKDLPEALPAMPPPPVYSGKFEYHIFMGRDTRTPGHYHLYQHAMIFQIRGRKRVLLYSPRDASRLYAYPVRRSQHFQTSRVDFLDPDLGSFPLIEGTSPFETTLEPGDALFVPIHWWHGVYGLGKVMSVSLFWSARWWEHRLADVRVQDVVGTLRWRVWPAARRAVARS